MKSRASSPSQLEDHIGYWLRYVSNHVSIAFQKKLESSGVTVAEWVALRQLYTLKETSPSLLADAMGVSRGAVSRLLERLVQKGLVNRESSAQDRRAQLVQLTEAGFGLVPLLAKLADQNDEAFFGALSLSQKDQLAEILKQLVSVHNLKNIPLE